MNYSLHKECIIDAITLLPDLAVGFPSISSFTVSLNLTIRSQDESPSNFSGCCQYVLFAVTVCPHLLITSIISFYNLFTKNILL